MRRTGRTTRLVRLAIGRAVEGQRVAFVVHHMAMIRYVLRVVADDPKGRAGAIKPSRCRVDFPCGGSLLVCSSAARPNPADGKDSVFVDHVVRGQW